VFPKRKKVPIKEKKSGREGISAIAEREKKPEGDVKTLRNPNWGGGKMAN